MRVPWTLAIVVLLAGCAPTTFTYYKPIGPGNYFKTCGGGPDQYLGFKAAEGLGVMIHTGVTADGMPAPDSLDEVLISFRIGEGHWIQIQSPTFLLLPTENTQRLTVTVNEVTRVDYTQIGDKRWDRKIVKLPIESRLDGGVLPEGLRSVLYADFQNWTAYALRLPVAQRGGKSFAIRFPEVVLDNKPVTLPDIRLEYGTYSHVRTLC
jgi:hypothetical protein